MRSAGSFVQRLYRRISPAYGKGRHVRGRERPEPFIYQRFELRAPFCEAGGGTRLPYFKKDDLLHRAAGAPIERLVEASPPLRPLKVKKRPPQRHTASLRRRVFLRHISRKFSVRRRDKQRLAVSPAPGIQDPPARLDRVGQSGFSIYDIEGIERKKGREDKNDGKDCKPALRRPLSAGKDKRRRKQQGYRERDRRRNKGTKKNRGANGKED